MLNEMGGKMERVLDPAPPETRTIVGMLSVFGNSFSIWVEAASYIICLEYSRLQLQQHIQ